MTPWQTIEALFKMLHSIYQDSKALGCFIYILDIDQTLVHSHFELVSSVLALEATELVSEPIMGHP